MAKKEAKFPYTTHVGLILDLRKDGADWVLTLTGDREKELKRGNFGSVMAEANRVYAHFEERRLTDPQDAA